MKIATPSLACIFTCRLFSEMDTSGDQRLDIEEIKELLHRLDRSMKSLPATAQVADQQGKYLGALLSNTNSNIVSQSTSKLEEAMKPFEYQHLESWAMTRLCCVW